MPFHKVAVQMSMSSLKLNYRYLHRMDPQMRHVMDSVTDIKYGNVVLVQLRGWGHEC